MTETTDAGVRRPPMSLLATLLDVSTMTIMASATITPALPGVQQHFAAEPHAELLVRLVLTLPGPAIMVSAPLPSRSPIIACSRVIPAIPSGNRALANRRPVASISVSHEQQLCFSVLTVDQRYAACGRTISALMKQCSRPTILGGHDIPAAIYSPDHQQKARSRVRPQSPGGGKCSPIGSAVGRTRFR
ncbi:hypothetical protein OG943_24540 [Amycolatopsis sp. NBC_00345]|uniref:hypothetical protein n=1 Tax=Amycolatopsis sp. NBC_00345 TaxID=2975955 RepID=UPI002E252F7B